ncbi:MAG: hypothetical protein ABI808_02395, partial [Pseudonocardiales bacterium]
ALIAQHCSHDVARERMGALVQQHGQPVPGLAHSLTHLFPSAQVLATAELICLPSTTAQAVRRFAATPA